MNWEYVKSRVFAVLLEFGLNRLNNPIIIKPINSQRTMFFKFISVKITLFNIKTIDCILFSVPNSNSFGSPVSNWVIKLPETASANDIYNNFSPSVIKGGLDEEQVPSDEVEVPVLGKIAAGTPVEAIQNEVARIPLPNNLEKNGDYFGLKVQGDSMIEAGIHEGDTVIIRRTDTADNGKIVVALIDEHEAMLKRIRKKGKVVALESANRNYETKIFGPDRVKVQGVLVSLYRNF